MSMQHLTLWALFTQSEGQISLMIFTLDSSQCHNDSSQWAQPTITYMIFHTSDTSLYITVWHEITYPFQCWTLGMDKLFHPTHCNGYGYLSMLGLKLIHVSKKGPKAINTVERHCNAVQLITMLFMAPQWAAFISGFKLTTDTHTSLHGWCLKHA